MSRGVCGIRERCALHPLFYVKPTTHSGRYSEAQRISIRLAILQVPKTCDAYHSDYSYQYDENPGCRNAKILLEIFPAIFHRPKTLNSSFDGSVKAPDRYRVARSRMIIWSRNNKMKRELLQSGDWTPSPIIRAREPLERQNEHQLLPDGRGRCQEQAMRAS